MMSQPNLGMPATTGAPPAVVYVPVAPQPKVYDRYLSKQSIGTGIAQIIIGALCIAFNIVDLAVTYVYALGCVGHGFWCGVMFIIAGGFGIGAGKNKTKCQVVAYMVLCIISASFTAGLLTVGIMGAVFISYDSSQYSYYCNENNRGFYSRYPYYCYSNVYQTGIAMESLLAILGLTEAIIAIYAAAMCCKAGVCCCGTPTPIPVGYMSNNGPMICINQTQVGQHAYVPPIVMGYPQGPTAPPPAYAPNYPQNGWSFPPPQGTCFPPPQTGTAPVYSNAPPRDDKI